jgi:predicted metal-dependent phosphoesterase TrpH
MNTPNIDLHSHSTISDGLLTPTELVSYASKKDVQVLALTDHDDIAGLKEARLMSKKLNIIFINGVEISVTWRKRTLHIVGLNFDDSNVNLINGLKQIRIGRENRAKKMAHSLGMASIFNSLEGAKKYTKHSTIGRIHFAQFLVSQGYAKDIKNVFKKFLTPGKPGYVEHEWASLKDAVEWITQAGGDAIIAHPGRYDMGKKLYPSLLADFKSFGGSGIEVMSGSQDPSQSQYFAELAKEYDLFASCGSDFHGPGISHRSIGFVKNLPDECKPIWLKWPNVINNIH